MHARAQMLAVLSRTKAIVSDTASYVRRLHMGRVAVDRHGHALSHGAHDRAYRWGIVGAIQHVATQDWIADDAEHAALDRIARLIDPDYDRAALRATCVIAEWERRMSTSHADVTALMTTAIHVADGSIDDPH